MAKGNYSAGAKKAQAVRVPPAPKAPKKKQTMKIVLLVIFSFLLLLMVGAVGFLSLSGFSLDERVIYHNITFLDTNLGGMSKEEAKTAIHQLTDSTYPKQDMVLNVNGTEIHFSPADTGAVLDVETLVEDAYRYGRTGRKADREAAIAALETNAYVLDPMKYLTLNTDAIRATLDANKNLFQSTYQASSAELRGDMPVLDAADENFNPDAKAQTLVLTFGNPGRNINTDQVYNQILDGYRRNELLVVIDTTAENQEPEALDLEAIFKEYCTDCVDASMDPETFEVVPEIYGYTFDLEKAMKDLAAATYGDVIEVPFQLVVPEINAESLQSILFRDVLATYSTKHTSNAARNNNLELACAALNGMILNPGDVFDYNTALGKRTAEAGYKAAPAYNGGATVNELGGGICQVSSTLYYCTLIADLEIVTRTAHSYVSSYIPYGMDATVSWGGPNSSSPITPITPFVWKPMWLMAMCTSPSSAPTRRITT